MHKEFNSQIGVRIKDIRLQKGYSRDELAELAEISAQFLGHIETGVKGMSAKTLYDISRALNVSADYLLSGIKTNGKPVDYVDEALSTAPQEELKLTETVLERALDIVRAHEIRRKRKEAKD